MKDQRQRIRETFNQFDGKNLDDLSKFYAESVRFEDPVTKISGLKNLKAYYAHAYKSIRSIRFEFGQIFAQGQSYTCPWIMHIQARGLNGGREYQVHGVSLLQFDSQDLVDYHRDYVDLGEMVYEQLPVQGFIIRQLKKLLKGQSH